MIPVRQQLAWRVRPGSTRSTPQPTLTSQGPFTASAADTGAADAA
ncbi:hypothetical protein [Micromonospora sp. AMSO1212t]|nr:hypothetical protein [Micromonospora sp. AMSO1212t]